MDTSVWLTCPPLRDRTYRLHSTLNLLSYNVSTGWYIDDINVETGATSFQFPETWETGLGNWNSESGTWEIGSPSSGPGGAYQGLKCAATVLKRQLYRQCGIPVDQPGVYRTCSRRASQASVLALVQFQFQRLWKGAGKSEREQYMDWCITTSILILPAEFGHVRWLTCPPLRDRTYRLLSTLNLLSYNVSTGWYIDDINVETGATSFQFPETWETGLGNWNSESGTWEIGSPSSGPGGAYQGLKCAATVLKWQLYRQCGIPVDQPGVYRTCSRRASQASVLALVQFQFQRLWKGAGKSEREQYMDWCITTSILILPAEFGHVRWLTCPPLRDRTYRLLSTLNLLSYNVSTGWYIDDINVETGATSFQYPRNMGDRIGQLEQRKWYLGGRGPLFRPGRSLPGSEMCRHGT